MKPRASVIVDGLRDTGFNVRAFTPASCSDGLTDARDDDVAGRESSDLLRHCPDCGARSFVWYTSKGGSVARQVCETCGYVGYTNPNIVVRCLCEWHGRLLLCRRADEPRRGLWSIPGGFLETGEALHEAAIREVQEEANAALHSVKLFRMYEMPQMSQVIVTFRAQLANDRIAPGDEALDVALFAPDAIPWHDLAFPTDREAILAFLAAVPREDFHVKLAQLIWSGDGRIFVSER